MKKTGKRFVPAIVVLSLVLSAIGLAQEAWRGVPAGHRSRGKVT